MTDETRGNAYFTMANWLIHKYRVPPSVLTKPGGRKVIAVVFMLLFHRNEAREDAYPGVGTLARLIGTAPNTVRAALHLAHDLGLIDWTERKGQSHVFTFPKLELAARTQKGTPPANATKAAPAAPVDETGLEPPSADMSLPDSEFAHMIAQNAHLFHVNQKYTHTFFKKVMSALQKGVEKLAITAAFKANHAACTYNDYWDILDPLLPDKAEVRRREEERKAKQQADEETRRTRKLLDDMRRKRDEAEREKAESGRKLK